MTAVETVRCGSCGHEEPMSEALVELSFAMLTPDTSRTSCPACRCFTLQQVTDWDGQTPTGGQFLIVKTFNTITKRRR